MAGRAARFQQRIELPDRIEHAEAMLFSARRLIVQLCGWLSTQQLALTHATLTLEHERGRDAIDPTVIQIALAEPTWHEEHLLRLFKERLGRTELVAPVIAMRLSAAKYSLPNRLPKRFFPNPAVHLKTTTACLNCWLRGWAPRTCCVRRLHRITGLSRRTDGSPSPTPPIRKA